MPGWAHLEPGSPCNLGAESSQGYRESGNPVWNFPLGAEPSSLLLLSHSG